MEKVTPREVLMLSKVRYFIHWCPLNRYSEYNYFSMNLKTILTLDNFLKL